MLDAGVVDQHVDTSELAHRMLDQPRGIGWLGQISAAKGHAYAVGRGNLPAQPIDLRGLAKAVDHEICTGSCKRASDPESNAARRTGNDSHLAL